MDRNLSKILVSLKSFKNHRGENILPDVLSSEQLLELTYHINNNIDKEDKYYSERFNEVFSVPKEKTNIVNHFQHSMLRFALILEECIELGFAYGLEKRTVYEKFIQVFEKVYNKPKFQTNEKQLEEVFDAQIDLLVVVYGAMYVNNFIDISNEGMKEVYRANYSKLCNNMEEVEATIKKYEKEGIKCKTQPSEEGFIILNKETNKVLKSINFKSPNSKEILFKNGKL